MAEEYSPSDSNPPSRLHLRLLLPLVLVGAFLLFLAITGLRIARAAREVPARKADAIVIFGAAEYAGRPSPVYRARLDHGFELFKKGMAPVVITTGGAALDPDFSEGGVGRDYLLRRGAPEQALIAETQGSDTAQSAERVANIMHVNGMHSCIAVSDAYHVFRIRALLEHEGIHVEVAPRPESRPHSLVQRFGAAMREAMSYLLWKVDLT
ncbi:MAG TPA: YdcF family protein [Bryobacteraceae bacterium]|nr:YdcF family protein [Bryobacteraceae bacterium]